MPWASWRASSTARNIASAGSPPARERVSSSGTGVSGRRLGAVGEPAGGHRAALLEAGRHQVHHLVQGRGQGDFGGGDRGLAGVGRLEQPGVEDDLPGRGRGLGAETQAEVVVPRQGTGETGHRRGDPLVAGHHGLDRPLLGGQDLGEQRGLTPRHSPSLSHGGAPGMAEAFPEKPGAKD